MNDPSGEYLRNTVMTASPEQLHLMLYDGAIRFALQAREALERRDWETSCEKLLRAQRIVQELRSGLRPEVNPALCEQMAGLYSFVYKRLVDANTQHSTEAINDALGILDHQRETWRLLIKRIRDDASAADSAKPVSRTSPAVHTAGPGAQLSVEG